MQEIIRNKKSMIWCNILSSMSWSRYSMFYNTGKPESSSSAYQTRK